MGCRWTCTAVRRYPFDPGTKALSAFEEVFEYLYVQYQHIKSFYRRKDTNVRVLIQSKCHQNTHRPPRIRSLPKFPSFNLRPPSPTPHLEPNALVMTCSGRPAVRHLYNLKHTSPLWPFLLHALHTTAREDNFLHNSIYQHTICDFHCIFWIVLEPC